MSYFYVNGYMRYLERGLSYFSRLNDDYKSIESHTFNDEVVDVEFYSIKIDIVVDIEPSYENYVKYTLEDMSFDDFEDDYSAYYKEVI